MKLLTVTVPPADTEPELKITLESLCGRDSRLEILVVYDPDSKHLAGVVQEYRSRFPEVREIRLDALADRDAAINAGMRDAIGRNFKIVEPGDTLSAEAIPLILEKMEQCEVDVFLTGFQHIHPKTGEPQILVPDLSCSGRQIDMIKLSENFEKMRKFLNFSCLCFHTEFLREVRKKVGSAGISGDMAFSILPFIYAESMVILPEPLYELKGVPSCNEETFPDAVRETVSYYESCKPLGKARSAFLEQWLSLEILHCYRDLLQKNEKKEGLEKAEDFHKWLLDAAPELEKSTEWKYRLLRRTEKYRRLFHCKNKPVVVESCHV